VDAALIEHAERTVLSFNVITLDRLRGDPGPSRAHALDVESTAALRLFFQEAREFGPIEPVPVVFQRGEKLEFTVCEDYHWSASIGRDKT
jgi:hypothetical protein